MLLISNFRLVLNVVYFLLGNSPKSEVYIPTFRNILPVRSSQACKPTCEDGTDSVPKRRHINFRRRRIAQKKHTTLYNVLYHYQCSTIFGRFFRPSSGAYKCICAA
jgi:hypothetical protein